MSSAFCPTPKFPSVIDNLFNKDLFTELLLSNTNNFLYPISNKDQRLSDDKIGKVSTWFQPKEFIEKIITDKRHTIRSQ